MRPELNKLVCGKCCIPFWITRDMVKRRGVDQSAVYCPNGHANRISAESARRV